MNPAEENPDRHDATTLRFDGPVEPDPALDRISELVLDAAFRVHRNLGPGLLESVYEECLVFELQRMGLAVECQVAIPITYEGQPLRTGLRIDLLVEGRLVVEVKAVAKLLPLHRAQLLTYLKLTQHPLGLLLNFNEVMLRDGIRRVILSIHT